VSLFKLREAIMTLEIETLRTIAPPNTMPFENSPARPRRFAGERLGALAAFLYTQVLGFKVTEIYLEDLQPGGFALLPYSLDK